MQIARRVPRQVESKITQWVRFQYTEELDDMQVDNAPSWREILTLAL